MKIWGPEDDWQVDQSDLFVRVEKGIQRSLTLDGEWAGLGWNLSFGLKAQAQLFGSMMACPTSLLTHELGEDMPEKIQAPELTMQKLVRKKWDVYVHTLNHWQEKTKKLTYACIFSFLLMCFNGTIWSCIRPTPNTDSLGLHAIQEILFWGARGTQWVDRPTDFLDPCRPASRPTSRAYRNLSHRACSCRRPVGGFLRFSIQELTVSPPKL